MTLSGSVTVLFYSKCLSLKSHTHRRAHTHLITHHTDTHTVRARTHPSPLPGHTERREIVLHSQNQVQARHSDCSARLSSISELTRNENLTIFSDCREFYTSQTDLDFFQRPGVYVRLHEDLNWALWKMRIPLVCLNFNMQMFTCLLINTFKVFKRFPVRPTLPPVSVLIYVHVYTV